MKFVDLKTQDKLIKKNIIKNINKIISTNDFINGQFNKTVEKKFSEKYRIIYPSLVSSGTDALYLALRLLKKKFKKGEIITTPFTFFAPSETILNAGFKPIYADINLYDYNISVKSIESKINKNTIAILPVHIFGYPCDMMNIMRLAKKYNLFVIEDCAQALGAKIKNKFVGTFGDVNAFSFYPTKNLGAYGDAGLVGTKNKKYFNYLKLLQNHGSKVPYKHLIVGENSRCDTFQASVLSEKLKTIDSLNKKRNLLAKQYFKLLKNNIHIKLPEYNRNNQSIYHQFTILAENRNKLQKYLSKNKIPNMIYYKEPLYKQKFFKKNKIKLKNVELVTQQCISLPIHPSLKYSDIKKVCKTINQFYNQ
jgi:UDP-2-acetamido-2-deoxy-ribo-hexuluronate aminotransferase